MLQVKVAKAKSNKQITSVTNDDGELYECGKMTSWFVHQP
jgi:hypothetical protein